MSSSESFFTKSDDMTSSVQFSERTTLSSRGYSLLVKAKRYGRWWLLKGLKEEYRHDGIFQAFLQKEYDILSQMQHPMVLSAFSFEEVEGVGRCIIMEWIDGLTLKEWLQEHHSLRERRHIADLLMEALDYVHSQQTEHRDLKPSNVMVTNGGHFIKLIDFGLSDTRSHAILKADAGTEGYMAPDGPSDIYSLGIIFQELRLGLFSRLVIRRCLAPREGRWQHVSDLRKALHRSWRWPRLAILCLTAALLLTTFTIFILRYANRNTQRQIQVIESTLTDSLLSTQAASERTADSLQQHITELEVQQQALELQTQQRLAVISNIQKSIDREVRACGIETLLDTALTRMSIGVNLVQTEQRLHQFVEQRVNQFPSLPRGNTKGGIDPSDRVYIKAQLLDYLKSTYTNRWEKRYYALPLY